MLRRIYVRRNYKQITCGSIHRVKNVYTEYGDNGFTRFFIEGDDQDYSVLAKLDYLDPSIMNSPVVPSFDNSPTPEIKVQETPTEPIKKDNVDIPEFYCKDHDQVHAIGDHDYYVCIHKFLSGSWDSDPDPAADESTDADNRLHVLNTGQCKRLITKVLDGKELHALYTGELNHPKFPGGRHGIKLSIINRYKNLGIGVPPFGK